MLTHLRLSNFKSFRKADISLGPMNVLVGPNAGGKSNLRDAFRVLHSIGRGYNLADMLGGKYGPGGVEWRGIRGAAQDLVYRRAQRSSATRCQLTATFDRTGIAEAAVDCRYQVRISVAKGAAAVAGERLWSGDEIMFEDEYDARGDLRNTDRIPVRFPGPVTNWKYPILDARLPVLLQVPRQDGAREDVRAAAEAVQRALASMRFLDVSPDAVRLPSMPGQTVMGDRGENVPSVLQHIMEDSHHRAEVLDWLAALTPAEYSDLDFERDLSGRVNLVLVDKRGERRRTFLAESASDGTLRFLAALAALFGPEPAALYFFEEIENGIHPSRAHLLLELIRQQTRSRGLQVLFTTHSPAILAALGEDDLSRVLYMTPSDGLDGTETTVTPLADVPHLVDNLKTSRLEQLFGEGWVETALGFSAAESPS